MTRITASLLDAKLNHVNDLLETRGSTGRLAFYRAYEGHGVHLVGPQGTRATLLATSPARITAAYLDGMRDLLTSSTLTPGA